MQDLVQTLLPPISLNFFILQNCNSYLLCSPTEDIIISHIHIIVLKLLKHKNNLFHFNDKLPCVSSVPVEYDICYIIAFTYNVAIKKTFQVCLLGNRWLFKKIILSNLNPQKKCFCYIDNIQLRKIKQYLLSIWYLKSKNTWGN